MKNTKKETAKRVFNNVTKEDIDKAFEIVEKHNSIVDPNNKAGYGENGMSFYIIEPTGRHEVFFTLYRLNHLCINTRLPNPRYIKNLSVNLLEAVKKIATGKGLPIELGGVENYKRKNGYTMEGVPFVTFGKYNGQTLDVIYEKDPQYVLWFAKNYDPHAFKTTDKKLALKEHAESLADAHFQAITVNNQAECKSEYQGELKERKEWELTLYGVKVVNSSNYGDYTIIYLKDNLSTRKIVKNIKTDKIEKDKNIFDKQQKMC